MSATFLRKRMDPMEERTLFHGGLPERVPLYTDDERRRGALEDGHAVPRVLHGSFPVDRIPSTYALKFIAISDRKAALEHVQRFRAAMWRAVEAAGVDLVDALNEGNVGVVSVTWDRGTGRGAHDPRVHAPTCGCFAWRGDRASRDRAFVTAVVQGRKPSVVLEREGLGHVRAAMAAAGWRDGTASPELRRAAMEAAQAALGRAA